MIKNFAIMDFLKNAMGGEKQSENNEQSQKSQSGGGGGGGGFLGGMSERLNSAAGGGKESEKNEDLLDKGMKKSMTNITLLRALRIPEIRDTHTDRLRTCWCVN